MKLHAFFVLSIAALGTVAGMACQAAQPAMDAGLVAVQSQDLDQFYLRPSADLAGYRRILLDPAQVTFRNDFNKNSQDSLGFTRRLLPDEVAQIARDAATSMDEAVTQAFKARGYEIVASPGPGVLRLSPSVVDLYVNAPDARPAGTSVSYTKDSGVATLVLEARDAVSGALLGRVVDHRRADETTRHLTRATSVSQNFWFEVAFSRWAVSCARAFEAPPPAKIGYESHR